MSVYQPIIREELAAAGRTDRADEATAAVVEEMMRTNRTSLSHLSRQEIATEAVGLVTALDDAPEEVRQFAETFGLEVPPWVQPGA